MSVPPCTPRTQPTKAASLIVMEGIVLHRVGFMWSTGWFESVAEFEEKADAQAAYDAAHAALERAGLGPLMGMTGKAI